MIDIFLDRDGVINFNRPDHVKSQQEFEFLPGVKQALARLRQADYRVFVVTNQALINRGFLSTQQLDLIHQYMCEEVAQEGGYIQAVLYCPHRPDENCLCRKPRPGLLKQAAQKYGAQSVGNWLIGDHWNDMEAGRLAGCRTMLVLSGRSQAHQVGPHQPVALNLAAAVDQILLLDSLSTAYNSPAKKSYSVQLNTLI